MVGLTSVHLGSSKLCGDSARPPLRRSTFPRTITADELLAQGPRGGADSAQRRRHDRVHSSTARLLDAAAHADDAPEMLQATIERESQNDTSMQTLKEVQGRLSRVILDKVKRAFVETSVSKPKSELRTQRMIGLRKNIESARSVSQRSDTTTRDEFRQYEADAAALDVIARAHALHQEAHDFAKHMDLGRAVASRRDGAEIAGEAMVMLRAWRNHSEVASSLLDALRVMVEIFDEDFKLEMDRRGLSVLASTIADTWADRKQVLHRALRLLGVLAITQLVNNVEDAMDSEAMVSIGLEILKKRAEEDPHVRDKIVKHGGLEVLDILEPMWAADKMISLHALNLRRVLRRSAAKSRREKREIEVPAEEMTRWRTLFESADVCGTGAISTEALGTTLESIGMKVGGCELAELVAEVDADCSGRIQWPEFMWLMSRFGSDGSLQNQFTAERLAELSEVFSLFDQDGNGSLDVKELGLVMRNVGLSPTEHEIKSMIASVDADDSGCIEWKEFLYLMSKQVPDAENQHRLAFDFFDREGSGRINKQDFIQQVRNITQEFSRKELVEMFHQAKFEDVNHNSLTYREFVKMMLRS